MRTEEVIKNVLERLEDVRELVNEQADLLNAYIDTGLTPKEIELYKEAQEICESMKPERLIELSRAEKDGRLVVLPCKVGDTVYRVFSVKDREPVIVPCEIKTVGQAADLVGRIGKKGWVVRIYLTREEAEEALKKKEADNA